jgi:SAM-dependent methyltransferase
MTTMAQRVYSRKDKYVNVSRFLQDKRGTVLDIGARDRILGSLLNQQSLKYYSADLDQGHDYCLDLEEKLPLADQSFDYVVALDVLEHVEQIHQAFHELARIARTGLIVALPNMATWPRRWSFLWRGNLGTGKYDLLPEHQGDRHRWLTVYSEMNQFIEANAIQSGFTVASVIEELESGPIANRLAFLGTSLGLVRNGALTGRCIYIMTRK